MEFTEEEWGRERPKADPVEPSGQPRGEARLPLPHVASFMGMTNLASRAYYYTFDEAMAHSRENAERMRLDPVIDACLKLLSEPVALLTQHIDPDDPDDPYAIEVAARVQGRVDAIPGLLNAKRWLLDNGTFVGRSAVQVRWQWQARRDKTWMTPTKFVPVHGDKLVFTWDDRVGILVNTMAFPLPTLPTERGRAYVLDDEERECLVVHEYQPEDASFYRPQMAGAVHGSGVRGKLYWLWALKNRVWSMGMDFLQWFARGLTVFYFPGGNPTYANEVSEWIKNQDGSEAMMLPWYPTDGYNYKPVERFDAPTASPQFIQALVTQYFDDLFKLVILGQTLTSGTASTGLGSGVAAAHQQTFENRVKYQAVGLQETLTRDLLGPMYRANFPGVAPGRWVIEVDDPNVQQMLENAQVLYSMGAAVPEQPLLDTAGLPAVKPGDTILTQLQPQQPAAVGGMPDGVPVEQGAPVKMTRGQWSGLVVKAVKGDRQAKRLLSRRLILT